jgi:hypothetical protein
MEWACVSMLKKMGKWVGYQIRWVIFRKKGEGKKLGNKIGGVFK